MPDYVPLRALVEVLAELGYHRPFETTASGTVGMDPRPHLFVSEGKVSGPKAVGIEPFDLNAPMLLAAARQWMVEIGIDEEAVDSALARFAD